MSTVAGTALHVGDLIVISLYFGFVLFIGLWTSRKNRGTAGGYFLAGRNMNWIPVGASLFASNIGSLHFVGMVGSGAASGIAIALYELNAMYVLLILAYIFLPVYIASGVYTMPEYLKLRFGGKRIQIYLAVLALLVYIFTKISADLYAGAIFIEQSLKWNIYGAIFFLLAVAAIFTIAVISRRPVHLSMLSWSFLLPVLCTIFFPSHWLLSHITIVETMVSGGLTAVIWTDFIQTVIMLVGALTLMILAFIKVGGFKEMVERYPVALSNYTIYNNNSCGETRSDYMHLFRDPVSGDIPWPGLVGITINSIWYWCSDQVIVQRALAGKTYDHAKAGTILCAFIKILPLFMLVMPGMIARILYPETVGCADPEVCMEVCGSETGCYNIAYPSLVIGLMPAGARGLMLAVMLSALMSSLTSIFNSAATIFAMDVWIYIRRKASELELMIVGRVFVVVLVVISIIWVPVLRSASSELYVYIQQVSSFLQPPICCIFVLALFWERLNEKGAFAGLLMGMVVGLIRFAIEYSYPSPSCTDVESDPTPSIVKNFHYLYFSTFLFVLTGIIAVVVSLLTKPIDPKCLQRLTFWTRHSRKPRCDIDESETSYGTVSDLSEHVKETEIKLDDVSGDSKKDHKENGMSANLMEADEKVGVEVMIEQPEMKKGSAPWYRMVFNYMCGLEDMDSTNIANKQIEKEDMLSIKEDKRWKMCSDVAAVLSMICCVGLAIYFG